MTTGYRYSILLLCSPSDRRVVDRLACALGEAGQETAVQSVAPGKEPVAALALALTAALQHAALVLVAVPAAGQAQLDALLTGGVAPTLGRWRVLWLVEGELEVGKAAVEGIAWPRLGRGKQRSQQRQEALARILELAGKTPVAALATAEEAPKTPESNRDNFTKDIRSKLYQRVGGFCSRPGCAHHTTGPHTQPDKATDTGVAAHITAAARGGPRYDPSLTSEQRKSAENGIWLCQICAKLIDSDPAAYPESLLREWKAWEEEAQRDRQLGVQRGRSDWVWPGGAWEFATYRKQRSKGFVRGDWLLKRVRQWALDPEAPQALLIGADYGVGKTAFLARLLDYATEGEGSSGPGLPVVAQHFCRWEENAYLSPGRFVQSVAAQLQEVLPAYRQLLEADRPTSQSARHSLERAEKEPLLAFQQAVVGPLAAIPAPVTPRLLVVDALDEALTYRPSGEDDKEWTIVDLLAQEARNLPSWLRLLATSRGRPEVLDPLREGFFSLEEIKAEEQRNLDDIYTYVDARCRQPPLDAGLSAAGLRASEVAEVLKSKSGGKFLYAVKVLDDLASGALPLSSRQSLEELPPGMDGFYRQAFARRYPNEASYATVQPILALLCEQREPMGCQAIGAILQRSAREVSMALQPLNDLLRLVPLPAATGSGRPDRLCSFDHLSLEQWLSEENPNDLLPRAGRFGVDAAAAAERIRTWALAEVAADRAHAWPYLVRHLASHLSAAERPEVIAGLLRQFPWLEARLRLAGLNALLRDFEPSSEPPTNLPPELLRLGRALRQAAHVLSHQQGWSGTEQLASQLLARLNDDGELADLRQQATQWLHKAGGAAPLAGSLVAQEALVRTLAMGSNVLSTVVLPDGRLANGCADGTIRLWDPTSGACQAVFDGHQDRVNALVLLSDGCLASGAGDATIRLWDLASSSCISMLQGHQDSVNAIAKLPNGLLASGSCDGSIRIWDTDKDSCSLVLRGHENSVDDLAVLPDGSLASCSFDQTIRIWDHASGICSSVFEGHQQWVTTLTVLADGKLASGSLDKSIRIWDPVRGVCTASFQELGGPVRSLIGLPDGRVACGVHHSIQVLDTTSGISLEVFEGHGSFVNALAVLPDGVIASGSDDRTIRLWSAASLPTPSTINWHRDSVNALAILPDGQVASGSDDRSVRLWDPGNGACKVVLQSGCDWVRSLAVLPDGRLASGSHDTIHIWDTITCTYSDVYDGHGSTVHALAVLPNGSLVSGAYSLRIWDTVSGLCTALIKGLECTVRTLAVLGDGRLATGLEDSSIKIWDAKTGAFPIILKGHQGWVSALAGFADGCLASGSHDKTIRLWNLDTSCCTFVFHGHEDLVNALAVLPNGRLASGSSDRTIRLWDPTSTTAAPQVIFVADHAITSLLVHSTHQLLVAGDASGRLHWLALPPTPR